MEKFWLLVLFVVLPVDIIAQNYAMGDADHNGAVNIVDALIVAQYTVGLSPPGLYFANADVNCSGTLTILDALMIAQRYVVIILAFPCTLSTLTPTPRVTPTIPVSTAASDLPVPPANGVPRPAGNPGNLTVLNWAGFKGAISYTFDDDNTSQINNYQTLNALGVRFTFYLWTNRAEASNSLWAQALRDGHEIGNHTASHQSNATGSDIDAATTFIKQRLGVTPYTMASPYGNTSYNSFAQSRFLLNRGVSGGSISPNDNSDAFNLPCHIPAAGASASALNSVADSARNSGRWQIYCIHGFTGSNDGAYNAFGLGEFTSSVNHVKAFGDVWIDSAVNVGAYWRGQKTFLSVTPTTSGNTTTWRWTLPANYPPGKYLRVKVDGGTLMQNASALAWNTHGYYELALDAGTLTLTP